MSPFLGACGATGLMQWTVECRGSAEVELVTLDLPFLIVGRHPRSDLHLPHPDVSDRHAYLQLVGGRLFCVDLGSRVGTYLDGRCRRAGWVDRGETIRIGPYRLRLVGGDREPSEVDGDELEAPGRSPRPGLALNLSHRSLRWSTCSPAGELILVGSSADCQARLLDPSVSGVHCALLRTPNGGWVVDLLGRGGVAINGTRTRLGRVAEGDELRIGDSLVRLPSTRLADGTSPTTSNHATSPLPSSVPALVSEADLRSLLSGLTPEKAELAESFLIPLANQLGLMQQHMFDRLQEAERERFQALVAFQGEQFAALREELEQLRELRQEIDEMRGELDARGRSPAGRDRSATRPRLGSASTPVSRDGQQTLTPPEAPSVLRMRLGEAT
jgi:pSer/pThr/pTyr-binding forkhead associated (FHA) protein